MQLVNMTTRENLGRVTHLNMIDNQVRGPFNALHVDPDHILDVVTDRGVTLARIGNCKLGSVTDDIPPVYMLTFEERFHARY